MWRVITVVTKACQKTIFVVKTLVIISSPVIGLKAQNCKGSNIIIYITWSAFTWGKNIWNYRYRVSCGVCMSPHVTFLCNVTTSGASAMCLSHECCHMNRPIFSILLKPACQPSLLLFYIKNLLYSYIISRQTSCLKFLAFRIRVKIIRLTHLGFSECLSSM
jgi:hypothetical protein